MKALNIVWFANFDPSTAIATIQQISQPQGTTGLTLAATNPQWFIDIDPVTGTQRLCTMLSSEGQLILTDTANGTYESETTNPIVIGSCILIGGRKPHHP